MKPTSDQIAQAIAAMNKNYGCTDARLATPEELKENRITLDATHGETAFAYSLSPRMASKCGFSTAFAIYGFSGGVWTLFID